MTLGAAIERLKSRLEVDLQAEVDITNSTKATEELMVAAQEFSRDSYAYYVPRSALTLTVQTDADLGRYELTTVCADRVFDVRGMFINGAWLAQLELPDFEAVHTDYYTMSASSNPNWWAYSGPDQIIIGPPPNATACAATNYVRGFREHRVMTYGTDKDTELQGPGRYHRLIVIKAALNLSEGYVASEQGYARRNSYLKTYNREVFGDPTNDITGIRRENLERVRPANRKLVAGQRRRIFTVGNHF